MSEGWLLRCLQNENGQQVRSMTGDEENRFSPIGTERKSIIPNRCFLLSYG